MSWALIQILMKNVMVFKELYTLNSFGLHSLENISGNQSFYVFQISRNIIRKYNYWSEVISHLKEIVTLFSIVMACWFTVVSRYCTTWQITLKMYLIIKVLVLELRVVCYCFWSKWSLKNFNLQWKNYLIGNM